ncbi:MAG: CHAT domain-containing protein [Microcystis aeruginosa G11-09]|nr:CHAT domain-containing protein [Microcystis aeruginosa G11-09]
MLPLLKKLWNWLKSLFIGSPKAVNPEKVQKSPPEPSDGEYEGILMGLFEQVAAGTTTGGLRGWLYSRYCDDKKLARWLGVKSEEWLQYPEDYQTLGRDLAALGKVMTGNLGEVSQRISLQLRDAVRDVSSVEGENLGSTETDLTEVQKLYQLLNQGKTSTTQRLSTANNIPIVQDAEFWFEQGNQKYMNGDFIGAIASFDRALEIKPDYHLAWCIRGIALDDLGRYEEAIASYDQALEIKPDYHLAWCIRGVALDNLGRYEEAIASYDQALEIKPDFHQAWDGRGWAICSLSKNRISTPSLEALIYRKPIVALNDREPHLFGLREALPHLIQGSPPWGQIYRYLGEAYLEHSRYKEKASPYCRDAIRHYQIALPILTEKDFPEDHLEILQGLIRAHLSLQEITQARFYQQQGRDLFNRLRAQKGDKPAFEAKFSSFSHLEIDLLIEENHPLDAIEQAEFYKNRCLTWILDNWQENPTSPDYATIQSLTSPDKAIIYWYLSEDNLTTFIITADADPVILEREQRYQQARQFRTWLTEWDKQYRDYASKKETENKQNHPWRLSLNNCFAQLKRILQIDKILAHLPVSVNSLILIPHRDLHRFPLHTLFPEKYTATYLPSAQVGLRPQSGDFSYSPLLSVEDPKTEQKPMDFAQLESAIISHILQPSARISPKKASRENVRKALENAYKTFHFTGHGFYDSFRPQASAIALSDGLLTVRDINGLNLSSYRLVCLAACETALTGKDGITTEYVGLVSAFRAAGATNVVSTLWPVKEISSAWFMINFYQRLLAGESPALALKNTQNWLKNITWQQLADWIEQLRLLPSLMEGVDRLEVRAANTLKEGSTIGLDQLTEYSDPYHWAAYTLTGQD